MKGHSRPRTASAPGAKVVVREGREKPFRNRHPWVFSGAVASVGDAIVDGEIADIVDANGAFLARGMVNRRSQILARVLTFDENERIDEAFWDSRIARAVARRGGRNGTRLVNAEADGLPGLVVDRYGDFLVVQASSLGMERRKAEIVSALVRVTSPRGIYDRSDTDGRDKEGLSPSAGLLAGEEPPALIEIAEPTSSDRIATLLVDVRHGHKTGAYLDQSENRGTVGACANGADVLNLFSYTGGFAVHAALGGAKSAMNVDSSADALALAEETALRNGVADRVTQVRGDVFDVLRKLRDEHASFDVVIVDPPKFAHSAAEVDRAARAYKDLARVSLALVRDGGHLVTFSCSGAISADLFQKITFSASLEARRDVRIVRRLTQAPDHPIWLTFPEGDYLKGLLCRVE